MKKELPLEAIVTLLEETVCISLNHGEVLYPEVRDLEGDPENVFLVLQTHCGKLNFTEGDNIEVVVDEFSMHLLEKGGETYEVSLLDLHRLID